MTELSLNCEASTQAASRRLRQCRQVWARRRSLGLALCCAVLACAGAAVARAQGFDPNVATYGASSSVLASIPVDLSLLRAQGGIPARWGLQLTPAGKATLFFGMDNAPVTVMGRTRRVRVGLLLAVLDPSKLPSPERAQDTSNFEGSPEDFYILSLSVSDQGFADWFRQGTGLGDLVQYVPGLNSELGPGPLHQYAFTAPAMSPIPVKFTATVTDPAFPLYSATSDWWRQTPEGTLRLEVADHNETLGLFQNWQLNTEPQSFLGRILGGAERSFTCQPTALPAPVLGVVTHRNDTGCIGIEHSSSVDWHKQIVVARSPQPASQPTAPPTGSTVTRPRSSRRTNHKRRHHRGRTHHLREIS